MDLRIPESVILCLILIYAALSCDRKETSDVDTGEPVIPSIDTFAEGFASPLGIVNSSDSRLFVISQDGTISILDTTGTINPVKFLDISDKVVTGGEQGLLGLAFHPDFRTNGWFYVHYTGENDSTCISRFSVLTDNPDRADHESEHRIFTLSQPYKNHNGGEIKFGPDGYLYIGLGDGGSGGDPHDFGQNLKVMYGKILRLDVNSGISYSIPASNPFINDTSALPEIWAYGLRNPWRFSFDRLTEDLWIADVGQQKLEEINLQTAGSAGGENYGWRCYEGTEEYNADGCGDSVSLVFPVYEYSHEISECSVTGGYVYRKDENSDFYGRYFFADYCSDKIWTLRREAGKWVEELFGEFSGNSFSSFGEDTAGNLYIAGHTSGIIYKFKL